MLLCVVLPENEANRKAEPKRDHMLRLADPDTSGIFTTGLVSYKSQ